MERDSKIYIAGHRGLVGSALMRRLRAEGYSRIVSRTHAELDLTDQRAVQHFFEQERPEYVFLAAAKVGGILANSTQPAEFIYQNLAIQTNVIHQAYLSGVKRLLFLGSSCIYPRDCPQPIREEYLLTGPLEATNRPYAIAKIAGIEMCSSYNRQYGTQYLAVMPTNAYGPGDNYDLNASHVIPGLVRKLHEAKMRGDRQAVVWGTGMPRREFLYSDDIAGACIFLIGLPEQIYNARITPAAGPPLINIGCGEDISVRDLAHLIKDTVRFNGDLVFDSAKPDGTPRKLLDVSRLKSLGWAPATSLRDGIAAVYKEFCRKTVPGASGASPQEAPRA